MGAGRASPACTAFGSRRGRGSEGEAWGRRLGCRHVPGSEEFQLPRPGVFSGARRSRAGGAGLRRAAERGAEKLPWVLVSPSLPVRDAFLSATGICWGLSKGGDSEGPCHSLGKDADNVAWPGAPVRVLPRRRRGGAACPLLTESPAPATPGPRDTGPQPLCEAARKPCPLPCLQ